MAANWAGHMADVGRMTSMLAYSMTYFYVPISTIVLEVL